MDRAMMRVEGFAPDAPATNVTVTGNRSDEPGVATSRFIRGFAFSDNGSITADLEGVDR